MTELRALAHRVCDLLVGVRVLLDEGAVAVTLLERREVLALQVLDQGELESLIVGDGDLDARQLGEAGLGARVEATLASDELVVRGVRERPDEEGLEESVGDGIQSVRSPMSPSCSWVARGWSRSCSTASI